MTTELSQVLAATAARRLSQEEELNLNLERLLRMRWALTWKYTEGGDRKAKARLVILGYQHPELTTVPTAAPTLGNVRLMKTFYGLTSAPRAWWLDIAQKLSQLGWKPVSTDRCLRRRYSDDGELKGVIGIHFDDFLIGLADGILGEKWMSEIKSLYRWGSKEGF